MIPQDGTSDSVIMVINARATAAAVVLSIFPKLLPMYSLTFAIARWSNVSGLRAVQGAARRGPSGFL